MGFSELEAFGKKTLEKYPVIKHMAKRAYQLAGVAMDRDRIKSEGDIVRISPDDGYEYFYGYYDKSPWDASERYMICLRVQRAYRSPAPKESGTVCLLDITDNYRLIEIGTTHSWNVQQGCMAQWVGPDYKDRIIYNDFRDGHYCAVIFNVGNMREERVLPLPVYDVSPDGTYALSLDFNRLHRMRPGYGYSNQPDKTKGLLCPDRTCIWKTDISTGKVTKLLKYSDFASFEPDVTMKGAEHKVNHLMISPNGKRFMVLHRWFDKGRKHTRLVTVNADGTEMYNLSDDVFVSHCYWKNDQEILSFLRKENGGDHYYLMKDRTGEFRMFWPELNSDGHCSYSPDRKYVITDTYPNRKRVASIYLCTEGDDRSRKIASVFSPFRYDNDCRCDLHPRWNRKGDMICFDSVHEGKRGLYVIPVGSVIKEIDLVEPKSMSVDVKLISFIIPAYNASSTIERCLESLRDQTADDWEAVVVNDGSTDNTLHLLEKYAGDNRITVITQENGGPGSARNNGITHATGEYISFLDSDDYLDSNFVELIKERIANTGADVVYYETYYESEAGSVIRTSRVYTHADKSREDFIIAQLSGTFSWGADKVISSKLIRSSGADFVEHEVGEEALFTLKILDKADRIEFVKCPLYHYVQSDDGQHKKGKEDPFNGAVHSVEKFLCENDILTKYHQALTNMAYRAVSVSLYRIACEHSFVDACSLMQKKLEEYEKEYDFSKVDASKLNRSAKLLLPFVQKKMIPAIYMASLLRKKSGNL